MTIYPAGRVYAAHPFPPPAKPEKKVTQLGREHYNPTPCMHLYVFAQQLQDTHRAQPFTLKKKLESGWDASECQRWGREHLIIIFYFILEIYRPFPRSDQTGFAGSHKNPHHLFDPRPQWAINK